MLKLEKFGKSEQLPDVHRCQCKKKKSTTQKKKLDLPHFVIVLLLVSNAHTVYSGKSPHNDWVVNVRGSRDPELQKRDYNTPCGGKYLQGYSLSGGTKAGRYVNLGNVESITDCSSLCCQKDECELAIMLLYPKTKTRSCFSVECYDDYNTNKCKPVVSAKSKYHPYMFKKQVEASGAGEDGQKEDTATNHNEENVTTNHGNYVEPMRPHLETIREEYDRSEKLLNAVTTNHNQKTVPTNHNEEKVVTKHNKDVCGQYAGSACADYVDTSRLYYYSTHNATALDKRLHGPMVTLRSRLNGKCRRLALQAICYRFYPQCADAANPKPIRICNGDCDKLINGDCADEFRIAKLITYLRRIIPGCNATQSVTATPECIELTDESPHEGSGETSHEAEGEISLHGRSERSDGAKDETNEKNSLGHLSANSSSVNNKRESALKDSSPKPHTPGAVSAATTVTPYITAASSHASRDNNVATTATPTTTTATTTTSKSTSRPSPTARTSKPTESTLTKLNKTNTLNTTDNISLSIVSEKEKVSTKEESINASKTNISVVDTTEVDLEVSAGENREITLPLNQVHLVGSTRPKQKEGDYTYKWTLLSAPKKSHADLSGETTKKLEVTNLDVPGVYSLKLEVTRVGKKQHGVGYVNITVKNHVHVNQPPRAEITSKSHVIQLPTNTAILDGSKSTDDDKVVSYKWEQVEGPTKDKSIFSSPTDSQELRLKGLVAGGYTFRLTVTDSNGASDTAETTITVNEDDDRPPIANAGNDIIIRLPNNNLTLNGNKSSDDKQVLTYHWSKTSDSPSCEMQGVDVPHLKLSNLQQGVYIFILKVTDTSGKSNEDRVMVTVLPQSKKSTPTAVAGDDKELVYPDDSTTLDASKSKSDSEIASYHWEQISGPATAKLTKSNSKKVHLLGLSPGTYVLKLTVTDDRNMVGTDTVSVHVRKNYNENPVAMAGEDQIIYLPTRSVVIDGSKSHDDDVIEHYLWTRAGSSPAAGVVINGSDHEPILRLTDLVRGRYVFELTVSDSKGLKHTDTVTVLVKEDPSSLGLVELSLYVDLDHFSEKSKNELILKISLIFAVGKESVVIEDISRSTYGIGTRLLFYVKDATTDTALDGKYVADIMKHKIGAGGKISEYTMQTVEPYICRNNCSDHGYCDTTTKQCVCDSFWVANLLKSKLGKKESNCDWSILYLSVAIFGVFLLCIFISWAVCFCCARKKRNRRRARYTALRNTAEDAREEILLIPKGMKEKFSVTSLTFSDSDEDSEDETTVFDKKIISNGHIRMNGTIKNTAKYRDHGMQ